MAGLSSCPRGQRPPMSLGGSYPPGEAVAALVAGSRCAALDPQQFHAGPNGYGSQFVLCTVNPPEHPAADDPLPLRPVFIGSTHRGKAAGLGPFVAQSPSRGQSVGAWLPGRCWIALEPAGQYLRAQKGQKCLADWFPPVQTPTACLSSDFFSLLQLVEPIQPVVVGFVIGQPIAHRLPVSRVE